MTRPGIEPRSPGPLANTLTPRPSGFKLRKNTTQTYGMLQKRGMLHASMEHLA